VKTLNSLAVVNRIEDLIQSLHSNFARSPKRHLEFVKLAEVLETWGQNIALSKDLVAQHNEPCYQGDE
jgi:hypothetical protein